MNRIDKQIESVEKEAGNKPGIFFCRRSNDGYEYIFIETTPLQRIKFHCLTQRKNE